MHQIQSTSETLAKLLKHDKLIAISLLICWINLEKGWLVIDFCNTVFITLSHK